MNLKEQLKCVKTIIETILETDHKARCNDNYLYLRVIHILAIGKGIVTLIIFPCLISLKICRIWASLHLKQYAEPVRSCRRNILNFQQMTSQEKNGRRMKQFTMRLRKKVLE